MPAYIPPHLRHAQPQAAHPPVNNTRPLNDVTLQPRPQARDSAKGSSNPRTPPPARPAPTIAPRRPHTPVLASPASDMRQRRAGTPLGGREVDAMDMVQSVSRSGGDGAEGDALKGWDMQERYRSHIQGKLEAHYNRFSSSPTTIPLAESALELESLGSIVLLVRKLREGVVASHRLDMFALQVFELSARLAIMARNTAQTISALSGLVPGLYLGYAGTTSVHPETPAVPEGEVKSTDSVDNLASRVGAISIAQHTGNRSNEEQGISVQDRKAEFASLLLLYHLCHTASFELYWSTLQELTAPRRRQLRHQGFPGPPSYAPAPRDTAQPQQQTPFISAAELQTARQCARYLSPRTFDPVAFFRLALDGSAPGRSHGDNGGGRVQVRISPHERATMQWAVPKVRDKAWAVMRKAYLEVRLPWAGEWLGMPQPTRLQAIERDGDSAWGEEDPRDRQRREELEGYVKGQGVGVESVSGRIKLG